MEQRNLLVGYDFNNDYTGISCMNPKTFEPESICVSKDEKKFLIPTAIGITRTTKEWVFGEDAIALEKENKAMIVRNIIDFVEAGEDIYLYETLVTPKIILERFIRKTLLLLKNYYPNNTIQKIVITLHNLNHTISTALYLALQSLGIEKDRAVVVSHDDSFQGYALSQSKELWSNNVGVFYFNEKGVYYSQLNITPYQIAAAKAEKQYNYIATSKEEDFTSILNHSLFEVESLERISNVFMNIAKSALHKQVVGTVYVTGQGFMSDWVDAGLMELCNNRRIFKGNNLYSRGAAFLAREYTDRKHLSEFYCIGKDVIKQTVSFVGYKYGSIQDIMLLDGNKKWYEIKESFHVILDEENELTFKIKDIYRKEEKVVKLPLQGLPNRPNKTTRLEIQVNSYSKDSIVLRVKDMGFGKIYPSTHRVWEVEIKF